MADLWPLGVWDDLVVMDDSKVWNDAITVIPVPPPAPPGRTLYVSGETRVYSVVGETRVMTAIAELRVLPIASETRVLSIGLEA